MWRADRRSDEAELTPDSVAPLATTVTAAQMLSIGDPRLSPVNAAEPVWARWRDELLRIGGVSPLLHLVDSPRTRIELSSTHPGGLAQFITGKATLLSNLVRDDLAFRTASIAASNMTAKGIELSGARGIDSGRRSWADSRSS